MIRALAYKAVQGLPPWLAIILLVGLFLLGGELSR